MNKEDLLAKLKDLISAGNIDQAKEFFAEHKDDLGEYLPELQEKFGSLLDGFDAKGLLGGIKNLFK